MKCLCKKDYIKDDVRFEKGKYYEYEVSFDHNTHYAIFLDDHYVWYFNIANIDVPNVFKFSTYFLSDRQLKLKKLL